MIGLSYITATDGLGQPVSDDALRLAALQTIFPKMQILLEQGKKIDQSWPTKPRAGELYFPDAFADEAVYSIIGKARNKAEDWASEDIVTQRFSKIRQVRFKLFVWPREVDTGLLAVLQYDFPGSSPPRSCPTVGLLLHLVKSGPGWTVKDKYLLETVHHDSVQNVQLLDLTGSGVDELIVESNWGGAGMVASSFQVFDLSRGRFEEIVDTESQMQDNMTGDRYIQVIDIDRTLQSLGRRFCFSKTTFFEAENRFRPPRLTHPCYTRGYGLNSAEAISQREMLAPLRKKTE